MRRVIAAVILLSASLWPVPARAAGGTQVRCTGFTFTVPASWVWKGDACPNVVYNTNDANALGDFQVFVGYHHAAIVDDLQSLVGTLANSLGDITADPQFAVRSLHGVKFVVGANRTVFRTPSNPSGTPRYIQHALTVCKGTVYEFVGEMLDTSSPLAKTTVSQIGAIVSSISVNKSCGIPTPPPTPPEPTQPPAAQPGLAVAPATATPSAQGTPSTQQTPVPTSTPPAGQTTDQGALPVTISLPTNPVFGSTPPWQVTTSPGATCTIAIREANGQPPGSFPDHINIPAPNGVISSSNITDATWTVESRAGNGSFTAACMLGSATATRQLTFTFSQ